jgi:hypothetical protein
VEMALGSTWDSAKNDPPASSPPAEATSFFVPLSPARPARWALSSASRFPSPPPRRATTPRSSSHAGPKLRAPGAAPHRIGILVAPVLRMSQTCCTSETDGSAIIRKTARNQQNRTCPGAVHRTPCLALPRDSALLRRLAKYSRSSIPSDGRRPISLHIELCRSHATQPGRRPVHLVLYFQLQGPAQRLRLFGAASMRVTTHITSVLPHAHRTTLPHRSHFHVTARFARDIFFHEKTGNGEV